MDNDGYKLGSLLFLGTCIIAVWTIAFSIPPKIESYHTGFTLNYSKKSDMQTQTEDTDPPHFPSSFETVEMICKRGECTRTEKKKIEPIEFVSEPSKQVEPMSNQITLVSESEPIENVQAPLVRRVTNFQQEPDELVPVEPIILGVDRKQIVMADPFNIEKNLK